MKHCGQTCSGTAPIGKLTGRKPPLHHLHNIGGNSNAKTLNGQITISGKSDGYKLFQGHIGNFRRFRVQTCLYAKSVKISEFRENDGV